VTGVGWEGWESIVEELIGGGRLGKGVQETAGRVWDRGRKVLGGAKEKGGSKGEGMGRLERGEWGGDERGERMVRVL